MTKPTQKYEAVVVGSSAGGIKALTTLLAALPGEFPLPIIIVQHLHPESDSYLAHILGTRCGLTVKQADEKESIVPGRVYLAPPAYHLLIEEDRTFSLSLEGPVNFARPAVDVLFESAIDAYRSGIIGIILTGANHDGSQGLRQIKEMGGYAIVEDPETAEVNAMPRAAIAAAKVDQILPVTQIGPYLLQLVNRSRKKRHASHLPHKWK
ncbi:MAG: chemotaxis protein CheB [Gammaproteobacteria bacterium]|nr:chemotaxis protein CheB [Gammaproteobacteria bacterium]